MQKLLWHSNAPWASTGYGQQTALFTPRLAECFDLAISAFYGLDGSRLQWGKIPVYPGQGNTYGNETIEGHARAHFDGHMRGGLLLTLMDVWVLKPELWRQFDLACWVPVDHDPVPPMVHQFFQRTGAIPIAMSRFGQEKLEQFDPLFCPHGCETKVYKPVDQREARKVVGLPKDAFVVGVVAANKGQPSRKSFPEILQAFAALRERHSEAILYLHTDVAGRMDGVNLPLIINSLGIPAESVRLADQYRLLHNPVPPALMAAIYSSFDVLLSPSKGEGFGLTVLEANACGVPAIVSEFSAQPEVNSSGWTVTGEPEWSGQLSWQFRPDVEDIVEALEAAYRQPRKAREMLAKQARAGAMVYDVETVLKDHMLPSLAAAAERYDERKPVDVVARSRKKHAAKTKVAA